MPDAINALAAEAAAAYPAGAAYSYAAQDALAARILVVEEGGVAFPQGSGIGAPDDDVGELVANVVASTAQYERRLIGHRTREALAAKRS
jgi:DNA invertase Pin-like site-specific DNA recombinase